MDKEKSSLEDFISKSNKTYSKIYKLHKYWARKPWQPISWFIKKYTKEKDLVVDLFLGSGVTALESIVLNRNFISFDLNPIAVFVAKNTIDYDFDEDEFKKELNLIKEHIENKMISIYSVKEKCPICFNNLIIDHSNIGPKFKDNKETICYCYKCGKRKTKRIIKQNESFFQTKYKITKWIPKNHFPKKFYKDRFSYKGIKKITDMFTNRNLYALSELLSVINELDIKYKNLFLLAFSNTLLHASKLKSENVRPLSVNNYWIPDDYLEENVWTRFLDRINLIIRSKKILKERISKLDKIGRCKILNKSSFNTSLEQESVDYIITDPPYGDAIQYSELSLIWNSWLQFDFKTDEEVIINPAQNKSKKDFINLLRESVREASRILKENHYFTLCFHNKQFNIWKDVLDLFKDFNFNLIDIKVIETLGNSYDNNWAKFSPKSDIYLTFRKSQYKGYSHYKEITIPAILNEIIHENGVLTPAEVYNKLLLKLIWELYYNSYQIDIQNLTIKKINALLRR